MPGPCLLVQGGREKNLRGVCGKLDSNILNSQRDIREAGWMLLFRGIDIMLNHNRLYWHAMKRKMMDKYNVIAKV